LARFCPSTLTPPPDALLPIEVKIDTLPDSKLDDAAVLCRDILNAAAVPRLNPVNPMRFLAVQNTDQADAPNYFTFFKNILKSFSVEAQSLEPFMVKKY
jgi:hypothetical protein